MKTRMKLIVNIFAINALLLQSMVMPAFAGISNLPPLVKPNVFPNIFFTLDDSGSMMFEHMPDSIAASYTVGFPQPTGIYKSGQNQADNVMPFGDGVGTDNAMVIKIAKYRNSSVNLIYYNPATRYDPWVDADGVPMAPATPSAALFNPIAPDGGSLASKIDLTSSNQSAAQLTWGITPNWDRSSTTANVAERRNFYPATHFVYIGGTGCGSAATATNIACFSRVEIKPAVATYVKSAERTDCASASCTYTEEIQNFANWFQYWRSRMLLARGGTGIAFGKQSSSIRVGFGAINAPSKSINGVSSSVILSGVTDDFSGVNRTAFYDQLYKYPNGKYGTPLRSATGKVGQYFERTDYGGPWANKINDSSKGQATCRQNYHILMTDGYWNEGNPGRGNIDGTDGVTMTAANGDTFKYTTTGYNYKPFGQANTFVPGKQYADSHNDTLADAAMQYWKNDLRPDWDSSKKNVPTNGRDPAFWQHVVMYTVGLGVIGTLDPDTDLPALTAGTKVWPAPSSNNINNVDDLWHAAINGRGDYFSVKNPKEFGDSLSAALNDIAGRAGNSAAVGTSSNTVVSGTKLYMTTYNTQNWSGTIKQLNINASGGIDAVANWEVNQNTTWPSTRNIFTFKDNSTKGIPFTFSNLATTDQLFFTTAKSTLFAGKVTENEIIDYLKGSQLKEKNQPNGEFRIRTSLLGDIVSSSPQYVAQGENDGYQYLPTGANGKSNYYSFYTGIKKTRPARVYVGANDGMLHAFNAATGMEDFAYVPKTVLKDLPKLADPAYTHQFYVDGTPTVADAYVNGWKTVLVGTTGAGGRGVFALDVTNGAGFSSTDVLWEWNSTNDLDIGYTIGRAQVGRLPNDDWVAIFGNGYESASNKAILFIANLRTGALTKINTGAGGPTTPNGLATPRLVIDDTGTIKAAYAGDLLGNMWKFDFTSSGGSVAFSGSRLFQAKDSSNKVQPITVQPDIISHPEGGTIVTFGTGKLFESNDPFSVDTQTIYGIWDKTGISSVTPTTISDTSSLVRQTQSSVGAGLTLLSNNTVDWATKRGWYINLTAGERVTIDPAVIYTSVFYTTITPGSVNDPCVTSGKSMNLLFDPITGGAINSITLDTNKNGTVEVTDIKASGMEVPLTFGSTLLRRKGGVAIIQPGADGTLKDDPPPADLPPIPALRLWRQILGKN